MIRIKSVIGSCVLTGVLSLSLSAHATTYYVATTGSDGNPGTSSQPWRTVTRAVNTMVAGDTTYVRGGTYREGLMRFTRSGTSSSPIRLLNAPGALPVIDCIDKTKYHRILFSNGAGYQKPIGWITIEGFEIRNCYNGVKIDNGHNLTIRRNWIHHSASAGIFGNGTRILIDRNRINSNASATIPNHGLYMNGTAITITNNLIHSNYNYGITLNGSSSSYYSSAKHAGPEFAVSANWIIANNTFAYSLREAAIVVWGSTCKYARIENNIFYENAVNRSTVDPQGINFVSTTCTGISIRNNLAYATGSGGRGFLGAAATQGVHYTQSGNIVNKTNPGFAYAPSTVVSSPNFALTSQSAAINKGVSTTAKVAYNAVPRPQGSTYDMGAYEYYPGGTTAQMLLSPTSARGF